MANFRDGLPRAIGEGALLLALSAGLAFGSNRLREEPLPLVADPRVIALEVNIPIIYAQQALAGFDAGDHIFLDARERDIYVKGHIGGAFSVPAESFHERYPLIAPLLSGDAKIVVYGWSAAPAAVERLAKVLQSAGISNASFLVDGYEGWLRLGAPTEEGDDPMFETLDAGGEMGADGAMDGGAEGEAEAPAEGEGS